MRNSKSEALNSKQTQNFKTQNSKQESFVFRELGFWICLVFRISSLGFTRAK